MADAAILLDGRFVGRTDADGVLAVGLDRPPDRLRVDLPGWVVVGGDLMGVDANGGAVPPGLFELVIDLAPEE